jgi:hypothetical protein
MAPATKKIESLFITEANKINIFYWSAIYFIPEINLMQVVSQKGTGRSIRDKKNSIISREFQEECSTPIRAVTRQISELHREDMEMSLEEEGRAYPQTSIKKDRVKEDGSFSEPKNAFKKKCFQKQRQIIPIQNLLEVHNSRISQKNQRLTRPDNSENTPEQRRALKSVFSSRKGSTSRSLSRSLASGSIASSTGQKISVNSRSVSQSKRIKLSITRGGNDCWFYNISCRK